MRSRVLRAILLLTAALVLADDARAQDSAAPDGALPHWLPSETWVYQHWLPFDEGRLYSVLGVTRGQVHRHLRDDAAHDLAQLGARKGYTARELAAKLVATRNVSAKRAATLRSRAYRVLTQGHLSQHIVFHSLHQTAIPNRSQWIFGVERLEFLRERRGELSPLQIGRLNGRTNASMRRRAEHALRAMAARGVREGAISSKQAAILLDRQLRQVPRWLGQSRYNGPPQTSPEAKPLLPQADFANNPSLSADGRILAWDAYRAKIPEAKALGEIRVLRTDLDSGVVQEVSGPPGGTPALGPGELRPRSAYNAALSADGGTVVFEAAEGNLNFAKRYSEMQVQLGTTGGDATWRTFRVSHPRGTAGPSRTAYNPSVSADGARVAFEATDAGTGGRPSRNALWIVDRTPAGVGRERVVGQGSASAAYAPRLTGDGRFVVFTAEDAADDGHSLVFRRGVGSGATELVSRADGAAGAPADADAHEPSVSRDGAVVTFTSAAKSLGAPDSSIFVRSLREARTVRLPTAPGTFAFDSSLSPDGRWVAYALRAGPRARSAAIHLYDRRTGRDRRLSGDGYASEPVVADGGVRVAWSTTAAMGDKPAGLTGVVAYDTATATARLVSTHAPLKPPASTRGHAARAGDAPLTGAFLCPLAP